jgi:hypothetical protein
MDNPNAVIVGYCITVGFILFIAFLFAFQDVDRGERPQRHDVAR